MAHNTNTNANTNNNTNTNNNNTTLPTNRNSECVGPHSNTAGKASTCTGCPNQQACASGKYAKEAEANATQNAKAESQILARLENVKNILLILSGKGGVGKSTISSQLAWSLCYYGYDVGILDIDICGPSIARMMGVECEQVHKSQFGWTPVYRKTNLSVMSVAFLLSHKNDAIIWRGPRKNGLIKQFLIDVEWNNLDFLIIDCPPGTSDEHISITQLLSGRQKDVYTLMVTTPQEVSLLDVRKEISFANKVGLNVLGVIENMSGFVCPCCSKKTQIFKPTTGGAKVLCKQLNTQYLGSIPIDQLLLQCCENGKSFLKYSVNKTQATATRIAWINVVKQITSRIDGKYAQEIEKKESYFQSKMAKRNSDNCGNNANIFAQNLQSYNNRKTEMVSENVEELSHGGDSDTTTDDSEDVENNKVITNGNNVKNNEYDTEMKDNEEYNKSGVQNVDENDEVRQHINKLDNATNEFLLDID